MIFRILKYRRQTEYMSSLASVPTSVVMSGSENHLLIAAVMFSFYKKYNIYYVLLCLSFFRTYMWKLMGILVFHTVIYIITSPKHMIRKKIIKATIQFVGMMSIYYL